MTFDPTSPCPVLPIHGPVRDAGAARRAALPHDGDDRRRTGARRAARGTRRCAVRGRGTRGSPAGGRHSRPTDRHHRLRDERARGHGDRGNARGRLGDGAPRIACVQAFELARRPPGSGVVVAVSHEGGTDATNAALRSAHEAGATTGLLTVSGRSPGAALAELVVTTEEQDQSWCHTVGYLSPMVAGAVIAGILGGESLDAIALRALLDAADSCPRGRRDRRGAGRMRPAADRRLGDRLRERA